MKLVYPACFLPLEEQEGYCVIFPDLPGCVTQGNDILDAIEKATDAASGWVLDELEDGKVAPEASDINTINLEPNQFINLVIIDLDAYSEKYGDRSIRKNCTIPAWLNTLAEKANINFSGVLQNALIKELHLNTPHT